MLTKRQKQIVDYIHKFQTKYGYSPSLIEIAKHLQLKSVSTIHHHIKSLESLGLINKEDNQPRGINITDVDQIVKIPLIGFIAAGQPIEAIEEQQTMISLVNSDIANPKDFYALRVVGESMVDEGIFDGDVVVIKKQSVAENGQTVVAIIDNNQATLKKLYREKTQFRLEPRNQAMLPFYRDEVEIRGVVYQIIQYILH